MAGIYIHFPFCTRKCHYCNFFSVASRKNRQQVVEAICKEIVLRRDYLSGRIVESVYFGGGTPSLLSRMELGEILAIINSNFILSSSPEITIEANPDDVNIALLKDFLNLGINRLSIGVQSFHDDDLVYLNRTHTAMRATQAIAEAKEAGFRNIGIDLIYGIPGLTTGKWEQNLEKVFASGAQHISAYSLTVEPGTALDLLIRKKKLAGPEEEDTVSHFRIMMERMKQNGFIHYEISNFCREGFHSRHNSMYWSGEHYLGAGPSAHSFNGISRQWNISGISTYIDRVKSNGDFFVTEMLTSVQKYNEYVMTSLRTMWGCDQVRIQREFGEEFAVLSSQSAVKFIESGLMEERGGVYYLTDEGKLFADGIASELFAEADDGPEG